MNKVYALLLALLLLIGCKSDNTGYFAADGLTQGTTYHIVFELTPDAVSSGLSYKAVCDSIELYLKDIDFAVSGYNKASVLSLFNNTPDSLFKQLYKITGETGPQNESDSSLLRRYAIFMENLSLARDAALKTNGLVDCSAAPLFDLWGFGFKEGVDVTQAQIDSVRQFIGMNCFLEICDGRDDSDSAKGVAPVFIEKADPRCRLNFNAVAQGFTADYIAARFKAMGINNFLVEVGGEIFAQGVNSKGSAWKVGIDKPFEGNNASGKDVQEVVELTDGALVTSGDYRKFYYKDGHKISHTINPLTGYPVEHNLLSATIMSATSAMADVYATYCMVLGLEGAQEFIQKESTVAGAILIYSLPNSSAGDSLAVWKCDKRIAE